MTCSLVGTAAALLLAAISGASALDLPNGYDPHDFPAKIGCTAIGIDAAGTVEGTAMSGMNADCSSCDNRMAYVTPKTYPNDTIREATQAKGLWDGQEPLNWNKVVGFDAMTFHTGAKEPIPAYGALRTWRIFNLANPGMAIPFQLDVRKMPFSIPVEKKLSHRDFMQYFSDYYAGTEFDLSQGMLAGPWGTPYRLEGGSAVFGQIPRGISIPRTSYSFFGQPKANVKDSVGWFAVDQPMTSVYLPFRADTDWDGVDKSYKRGLLLEFDHKSAFWAFQFVSNWMNMNFKNMSEQVVFPMRQKMQDLVDVELARMDELAANNETKKLEKAQRKLQKHVVDEWWSMGKKLIAMYNDGYYNRLPTKDTEPALGVTFGVPNWYAHMIGFTNDIHPIWVSPAESPINKQSTPPDYVTPKYTIPKASHIVQALQKAKKEVLGRTVSAEPLVLKSVSEASSSAAALGEGLDSATRGDSSSSWTRDILIATVCSVIGVAAGMYVENKRSPWLGDPILNPLAVTEAAGMSTMGYYDNAPKMSRVAMKRVATNDGKYRGGMCRPTWDKVNPDSVNNVNYRQKRHRDRLSRIDGHHGGKWPYRTN
ncbi:hypothetical protein FOL47_007026 [Perkinsus chesapeaki]|uniref:Uncharacterized protein n=1 Tax=Perkinsus chesapeaki TaxID=330153 RepID=A0A7J6LNL8_PERCH|nr:hypothetical protein FOL47_007026 [Perkinsus chesapeaki]